MESINPIYIAENNKNKTKHTTKMTSKINAIFNIFVTWSLLRYNTAKNTDNIRQITATYHMQIKQ